MMRIKIFSDFCDTNESKKTFETIWETHKMTNYGNEKEIYITTDDDYTHVIILNTEMPILKPNIPKENVIGLAYEPIPFLNLNPSFVEYANRYIYKYYIGDIKGILVNNKPLNTPPFIEGYSYMLHIPPSIHVPVKKEKNIMSIVISQKKYAPGHSYRHELTQRILKSNLPIDIYGRGCPFYGNSDKRIKGPFKEEEPYESYIYHICIENFRSNEYFSEKIINPLLYGTVPIYLGCRHIDNYFSDNIINLTGNLNIDLNIITDIVNFPIRHLKNIDCEKIKEKMNLMKNLHRIF